MVFQSPNEAVLRFGGFSLLKTSDLSRATVHSLTPASWLTERNAQTTGSPGCVTLTWAHTLQTTCFICVDSFWLSSFLKIQLGGCCGQLPDGKKAAVDEDAMFFFYYSEENLRDASGECRNLKKNAGNLEIMLSVSHAILANNLVSLLIQS